MKPVPLLLGLALFFLVSCVAPTHRIGGLPREVNCIAVIPFEVRYDVTSSDEILSEFMALDLYRLGAQGVLGPRELTQLFAQAKDRLPPSIDPYWARKIGQRLGVEGVIFGALSRLPVFRSRKEPGQEIQFGIDAYLLDVRSGEIRWTFGTHEHVEAEQFVPRLNRYSELMASSLLGKRLEPFGQPNCWKKLEAVAEVEPPFSGAEGPKPAEKELLTSQQLAMLEAMRNPAGFRMDSVIFEGRSEQLTKEAIPILRNLAAIMQSPKGPRRIQAVGHIDATANSAEDLKLSKRRADVIRKYLKDLGVPVQRVEAVGFGGTKPEVPNINKKSRELNRRTVLYALEPRPKK